MVEQKTQELYYSKWENHPTDLILQKYFTFLQVLAVAKTNSIKEMNISASEILVMLKHVIFQNEGCVHITHSKFQDFKTVFLDQRITLLVLIFFGSWPNFKVLILKCDLSAITCDKIKNLFILSTMSSLTS